MVKILGSEQGDISEASSQDYREHKRDCIGNNERERLGVIDHIDTEREPIR